MGDQQSLATITVSLDKPYYYVGETIRGQVHLTASQHIPSCTGLLLHYENREQCDWSERHKGHLTNFLNGKVNFENEFLLQRFDNGVLPGSYSFPFHFELPMGLPSSFQNTPNVAIKILHSVRASLVDHSRPGVRLDYEVYATVIERPSREDYENTLLHNTSYPETCCCISQGSITLDVSVNTPAVKVGQPIALTVTVDNRQSKMDIREVDITITQVMITISKEKCYGSRSLRRHRRRIPGMLAGSIGSYQVELNTTEITQSTANGSISANIYLVRAQGILDGRICCSSTVCQPVVERKVFVDASGAMIPFQVPLSQPSSRPVSNYHYPLSPNPLLMQSHQQLRYPEPYELRAM